jgi:hypothetical protein
MDFIEEMDKRAEVRIPIAKWNELVNLLARLGDDILTVKQLVSKDTQDYYWKLMSF